MRMICLFLVPLNRTMQAGATRLAACDLFADTVGRLLQRGVDAHYSYYQLSHVIRHYETLCFFESKFRVASTRESVGAFNIVSPDDVAKEEISVGMRQFDKIFHFCLFRHLRYRTGNR